MSTMLRRAFKNASAMRGGKPGFDPDAMIQRALVHHREGRLPQAAAVYGEILETDPDHVDALHLLGVAALQSDDPSGALSLIDRAIANKPDFAEAYSNRSTALMALGRYEDALAACDAALRYAPKYADAWFNAGNALSKLGHPDEAVIRFSRALELKPDFVEARNNLGAELVDLGRLPEAVRCLTRTVQEDPGHVRAFLNLGNAYAESQELQKSIDCFRKATDLDPGYAKARVNLSNVLLSAGDVSGAIREANAAVTADSSLAEAHTSIANCYRVLGQPSEACDAFREALARAPGASAAHSNLLLSMLGDPTATPAAILDESLRFAARNAPWSPAPRVPLRPPQRIGFVSPDFRIHPVGFFLEPLLSSLEGLEVFLYSCSDVQDGQTARLADLASAIRPCRRLSAQALAETVRKDEIDVLIDLAGHTADNRLDVFALRPAPVQLTWLGYSGTTGLGQFDGIIGDPTVTPRSSEDGYSEAVLRLPHSFACLFSTDAVSGDTAVPAAANGYLTFGSFNSTTKVNPAVVKAWSRILLEVEGSRMVFKNFYLGDPAVRSHFGAQFESHGVSLDRIEFMGHTDRSEHLRAVSQVDIALDTFPYSGATTTLDCLLTGVPVITMTGDRYVSNMSASFLKTAGLWELVAGDSEAYVAGAVALAKDPDRLAGLRGRIRRSTEESPLGDAKLFASSFSSLLTKAWEGRMAESA